jgi:LacI family transcriptional regulator
MSETRARQALTSRATMKDVAALARVSLKTVSRVINDEPTVNPELAERVRRAATQLQYEPNVGASALRRTDRRSSQIAVLLQDLANPYSSTVYRGVEDIAVARGVSVIGGSFDEDPQREYELTRLMIRHRVDGVIMVPASHDQHYLRREQEAGVAFVFIDRPPSMLQADQVLSASRDGARLAMKHLVSYGHRRIGYLGDLQSIYTAQERYAGYRLALRDAGLEFDERLVRLDLHSTPAAEAAASELLATATPPTAIFAGQNLSTIGAVRAIRARGRQYEVAIVGFDDFVLADLLEPAISVVAQDPALIAREAAGLLFARLDGATFEPRTIVTPTTLIARGSGEIRVPAR